MGFANEKNGITLIALIVTIILILILARNEYKHANGAEPEF